MRASRLSEAIPRLRLFPGTLITLSRPEAIYPSTDLKDLLNLWAAALRLIILGGAFDVVGSPPARRYARSLLRESVGMLTSAFINASMAINVPAFILLLFLSHYRYSAKPTGAAMGYNEELVASYSRSLHAGYDVRRAR